MHDLAWRAQQIQVRRSQPRQRIEVKVHQLWQLDLPSVGCPLMRLLQAPADVGWHQADVAGVAVGAEGGADLPRMRRLDSWPPTASCTMRSLPPAYAPGDTTVGQRRLVPAPSSASP